MNIKGTPVKMENWITTRFRFEMRLSPGSTRLRPKTDIPLPLPLRVLNITNPPVLMSGSVIVPLSPPQRPGAKGRNMGCPGRLQGLQGIEVLSTGRRFTGVGWRGNEPHRVKDRGFFESQKGWVADEVRFLVGHKPYTVPFRYDPKRQSWRPRFRTETVMNNLNTEPWSSELKSLVNKRVDISPLVP